MNNNVESDNTLFENNKKFATELNTGVTYETKNMDIGTTIAAVTANTTAETVEVFNGALRL